MKNKVLMVLLSVLLLCGCQKPVKTEDSSLPPKADESVVDESSLDVDNYEVSDISGDISVIDLTESTQVMPIEDEMTIGNGNWLSITSTYTTPVKTLKPKNADIHLMVDATAVKAHQSLKEGDFVKNLSIEYELSIDDDIISSGPLTLRSTADSKYYGCNVKMKGPSYYSLTLYITIPKEGDTTVVYDNWAYIELDD